MYSSLQKNPSSLFLQNYRALLLKLSVYNAVSLKFVYMFYVDLMCFVVAITLANADCTPEWVPHEPMNSVLANVSITHPTASNLTECQKACEFDPRCVSVDWQLSGRNCRLNTNPNHEHKNAGKDYRHHELVSRCNITPGQCFNVYL